MKKLLFFLSFALFISDLCAQKTGIQYLPEKRSNTPMWMNQFYSGVTNANQIRDEYEHYYSIHPFEKNNYTQYYKRWMMANSRYVRDDGSVEPHDNIIPQLNEHFSGMRSPSTWNLIGPVETFKPTWDDAAQPAVPYQVNLYAFDVAPNNPDILYACPETGGVFKSIDRGLNWFSVSDNIRLGVATAIAIDPTNPDIVFAAAGNVLFKTIDGGVTWVNIFSVGGFDCNDIAIFTANPAIVLLASGNGLYKSTNGGTNFAMVAGTNGSVEDIETNPLRDSSVYIIRRSPSDTLYRFYRSYDGASTFNAQNNGWLIRTSTAGRMTVTPADTNYIYAVILMGSTIDAPALMRSTNAGTNWVNTCIGTPNNLSGNTSSPLGMSNGQDYYDLSIMASAINKEEVIVGTTTTYKSTDTANTFTAIGGYHGNFTLHPDVQEMKMIGNDAWIATDGGLNYSPDFYSNVATTEARNKGIYGSDFWGFGQGWNEDLVTGGRYHNGNTAMYEGYPAGNALKLGGAESGTGYGNVGRDMYVEHSDIGASILPKTFSGSKTDFTFTMYPNEDDYGKDASEVEFEPQCYNHIYIGKDSSLWKSIDGGVSYTEVHNFHELTRKFEICRSNPLVMYLATSLKMYKTIDGGINWTNIPRPGGHSMNEMSMTVSYTDENVLWITGKNNSTATRVYKTIDGGVSWINLTTPTISPYSFFIINHQAGTDGGVYISATSYAKVFYRNNLMTDWVDISANLPQEYKAISAKPFYMKHKLRTAGNRGIWETDLYEDGLPVCQPTVDKMESTCVRDTFYFDDFSAINHAVATWNWNFPGATYVSATNVRNPKVTYTTLGAHTATLTVTENGNVSSKSITVNVLTNNCGADTIPGNALSITADGGIASASALNLNSNTVTMSCWIKPEATINDWSGVVFCRGGTSCSGISLRDDFELRYHWDGNNWGYSSGLYVTPNEWNHIALVITPTTATLYVNGIAAVDNTAHAVEAFDAATIIGKDAYSNGRTFHGLVDEVCIWKRALTQDEIRATRHLTKVPSADTSLVVYYQFNEQSGEVLDRVGVKHATLTAGAARVPSTGPFAGGTSTKLAVNNGGTKVFAGTDVTMTFPTSGGSFYPAGDVWVSKLNYHPDQWPIPNFVVNKYWVVNNYGVNQSFSMLDSITFGGLPALTGFSNPRNYYLYKRESNADGATWGTPQDTADMYTLNGNNSRLRFGVTNDIGNFSQFSLYAGATPWSGVHEVMANNGFTVSSFPNPSENELFLDINSSKDIKNSTIIVYDMLGKQVILSHQSIKAGKNRVLLNMTSLSEGVYTISIDLDGTHRSERIVVRR